MRTFWVEMRDVLRRAPRLKLFLAVYLISGILGGLLVTVLPLFFLDRGMTFLQVGGIYSLMAVVAIVVQLLAGRHHRFFGRPAVVLGFVFVSVLTFPAYLLVHTPLQFLALAAAGSLSGAASGPGLQVLMAEVAPRNVRATVYAYFGLTKGWSHALGLVVGGLMLASGYRFVFLLGGLLSFASFLSLLALMVAGRHGGAGVGAGASVGGGVRAGPLAGSGLEERRLATEIRSMRASMRPVGTRLKRIRSRLLSTQPIPVQAGRNVRWASLYLFLFGLSVAVYPVYFPRYLVLQGLSVQWVGIVAASSWVAFGLAQPFGARYADRTGRHKLVLVSSLVAAAFFNLLMATTSLPWIIVSWILLGLADGLGRPVTAALIIDSVPPLQRGGAFGWSEASITASGIIAPYALAFLIMSHGIAFALALVSGTLLLAAVPPLLMQSMRTTSTAGAGGLGGADAAAAGGAA